MCDIPIHITHAPTQSKKGVRQAKRDKKTNAPRPSGDAIGNTNSFIPSMLPGDNAVQRTTSSSTGNPKTWAGYYLTRVKVDTIRKRGKDPCLLCLPVEHALAKGIALGLGGGQLIRMRPTTHSLYVYFQSDGATRSRSDDACPLPSPFPRGRMVNCFQLALLFRRDGCYCACLPAPVEC